ncbi:glycosyltransferase family 2 protein [Vibrio nitrifigilis]|uniref:Glycosyltransferase family 2 protein n=1 Tax=Vibrio nitrifigilis TaxID=2789781 RepID=A0ABS0GFL2_9VIBR|nr:glycosyltransferase family 2 protein [Vibrio nitrifigilis]MBF9001209.1 glycosyltransferase family 2 protein [Vibrio nitrifigilis]
MTAITVILPAFNAQAYICRAIDSVLDQTFTDFELLVINDGSTDLTQSLVEDYEDSRIRLVNMPHNVGLIAVLNYGLSIAKGKYVARMDADDICLPTRFEKQITFLEENEDYIACGTSIINFNTTTESYMQYPETDEQIRAALYFFERNICHPTVMIKRCVLEENNIRYRTEYLYAEDYILWFEISKHGKLYNLREGLLRYNRHSDQVSCKYYPQQMEISRMIVRKMIRSVWPELSSAQLDDIILLCVHEQGIFPDTHFSIRQVNKTIQWILNWNKNTGFFSQNALRKLLHFKKFRCSFYYIYPFNYTTKLWFFIDYLSIEPSRALTEIYAMTQVLVLKEMKKDNLLN